MLGNQGSEEYINKLIDEVDYQRDGKISYEEFLSAFQEKKGREVEEVLDDKTRRGSLLHKIMSPFA